MSLKTSAVRRVAEIDKPRGDHSTVLKKRDFKASIIQLNGDQGKWLGYAVSLIRNDGRR
ncbi:MAG: hypothetical protein NVS2B16_31340 [Chloroflexota bacterium]